MSRKVYWVRVGGSKRVFPFKKREADTAFAAAYDAKYG